MTNSLEWKQRYFRLDDDHNLVPCDTFTLSPQRRVALDMVGDVKVSTVFLGLDHGTSWDELPIVFETMVFGGGLDQEMARYSTWAEAVAGHAAMLEKVRAAGE